VSDRRGVLTMVAATLLGQAGLAQVPYGPAVTPAFETELITDTAGHLKTGGTGRSCWERCPP
jgi:hypothetical protein